MQRSSIRRILTSDIAAVPWKNGGGVTRELATGGGSGSDWGWRISLAEVAQDGPFSAFPGVDRIIAVIEGAGMDLVRPDGSTLALEPFRPVSFAGEDPLTGRLRNGPVRDLNVMVRRGAYVAELRFLRGPSSAALESHDGGCAAIFALAGSADELAPGEALLLDGAGSLDLKLGDGALAALIRIAAR